MHVVLVRPEIAPNTGNIIRLCANTGADLHLIEPLGFDLDDRLLRRAGLDYHEHADVTVHADLGRLLDALGGRAFGFSSKGSRSYHEVAFTDPQTEPGACPDVLVFGAERAGLSPAEAIRFGPDRLLRIPMLPGNRSLNLANAVAVVVYEAWRQRAFGGASPSPGHSLTAETPGAAPFDR